MRHHRWCYGITGAYIKRLRDGSQLETKHVAVNKLIKVVLFATNLIHIILNNTGCEGAQLVEALCYKPKVRRFDSPMVSVEFFIDIIHPVALRPSG
jgi:hypothetical protein